MNEFDYEKELKNLGGNLVTEQRFDRLRQAFDNLEEFLDEIDINRGSFIIACTEVGITYDERYVKYNFQFLDSREFIRASSMGRVLNACCSSIPEYIAALLGFSRFCKCYRTEDNDKLLRFIHKVISISTLPYNVSISNGVLQVFPVGCSMLDKLVNDVLGSLSRYKDSYKQFSDALALYSSGKYDRQFCDSLRHSFESLVRSVTGKSVRLEKSFEIIGLYLEKAGVSKFVRNAFEKFVDLYCHYQNNQVKHGDNVKQVEVEYILYQTATLMRLLLVVAESK
jgi:hypothetical protein